MSPAENLIAKYYSTLVCHLPHSSLFKTLEYYPYISYDLLGKFIILVADVLESAHRINFIIVEKSSALLHIKSFSWLFTNSCLLLPVG